MNQASTAEEQLARVAERDAGALGELYDNFAPTLLGLLLRILGDRDKADEILEEVFLDLWARAPTLRREPSSVAARLVEMSRNLAVERLRAGKSPKLAARADAVLPEIPAAWLAKPEEIASLDERRGLLVKILKQLPAAQREALDLIVFGGYTETELAEKLGQPLGRVKTELRAALRFLRHRLRAVLGTWSTNI